jgi:hypothetical protein
MSYYTYSQDDNGTISNVREIAAHNLRGVMAPLAQNVLYARDVHAEITEAKGWPFTAMIAGYGYAADSLDGAGRLVALLREATAGEMDAYKPHPTDYPVLEFGEKIQIEYK